MHPCHVESSENSANTQQAATVVVQQQEPGMPVYVRCDSSGPYVNPTICEETRRKTAAEINATELRLNLGQSFLTCENATLLSVIRLVHKYLVSWWESGLFALWSTVPLRGRRALTLAAWNVYLPLHKKLLGRRTAIHRDASLEYHALTTVLWFYRFVPVTVPRVRFALSHLLPTGGCHPTPPHRCGSAVAEEIAEPCNVARVDIPNVQRDHTSVQGIYLHYRPDKSLNSTPPTEYTLFWVYGGAFLAGDAQGSTGPANYVGTHCQMDVFIPTYRLAPESDIHDVLWDITVAYRWLCLTRLKRGQDPSKIMMFGCSSGASLCVRLMQFFAELKRGEELLPSYIAPLLQDLNVKMPVCAVLASPFVDYRPMPPKDGSFLQYSKHDLVVTQLMQECGMPYLDTHMCGRREEHSPVTRSLEGLPPICVLVSEHEAVYDEACLLVNKARAKGTPVTMGMWKYMCHYWYFLAGFLPEGKQAMDFICEWVQEHQEKNGLD